MKNTLLIFDLDGTLIDTVKDLNEAVVFSLKKNNMPTRSVEQTAKDIGNGVAKLIERSVPNGLENPLYQKCLDDFKDYYSKHYFDYSLPYKGIKETLSTLLERGYTLAVVSNKFNEGANNLVNHFFPGVFKVIQGEEPKYHKKPNPDMVNAVIKQLGFEKENCLYIGDTEVDYQTAINAHIPPISVSYGYRSHTFLQEKIKDVPIVDTPIELLDLLS